MRERGILFQGRLVRAILEDRKTVTRRVVVPQPVTAIRAFLVSVSPVAANLGKWRFVHADGTGDGPAVLCPHGRQGDRLYVRETWAPARDGDSGAEVTIYRADWEGNGKPEGPTYFPDFRWHPSIHMHRWRSRIDLEIVNVRAERLQDMDEEEAIAEGIHPDESKDPLARFRGLWNEINGPRGFAFKDNPWVWRIEFRRAS